MKRIIMSWVNKFFIRVYAVEQIGYGHVLFERSAEAYSFYCDTPKENHGQIKPKWILRRRFNKLKEFQGL